MSKNRVKILEGAKRVFFKAMLDGYVGDCKNSTKTKTPDGYTTIEFIDGDYRVIDRYCITLHSDFSAGTTTIFYQNSPIWWMSYVGEYPGYVIPFLKKALLKNYKLGVFRLGRGPNLYKEKLEDGTNMEYRCTDRTINGQSFYSFNGFEEIRDVDLNMFGDSRLGFHCFQGMSLL